ncbi:MAG: hypothetical protein NTU53_20710 [Planctomycetota bacterium]|nr:hypothetical protein [Planctomycetota bacterium]
MAEVVVTEVVLSYQNLCWPGGRPYGDPGWQARTAAALGLEHTFRNRGRAREEKQ